jgi:hypothetical protein
MEKITVMIGNSEDKITEIVASYNKDNVVFIDCDYYMYRRKRRKMLVGFSRHCSQNTELVIINGFKYASDIEELISDTYEGIAIEKKGKDIFYIYAKIIVICTEDVSIDDFPLESMAFKRRVSIINCNDGAKRLSDEDSQPSG